MSKFRIIALVVLSAVVLILLTTRQTIATPTIGLTPTVFGYLPAAFRAPPTPTPTNTPTRTPTPTKTPTPVIPTNTPTRTNTPIPTNTPTRTPTSAPPANIQLTYILYNPDGDDVAGEYVEMKNMGGTAANMTSWTLRDDDSHVFTFPNFTLQPNATVKVWTKSGSNNSSNLYWGSGAAIWNNTGDTAILRNAGGQNVDTCTYGGGGQGSSC